LELVDMVQNTVDDKSCNGYRNQLTHPKIKLYGTFVGVASTMSIVTRQNSTKKTSTSP